MMATAAKDEYDVDWEDLEGKVQALMRFSAALTAGGGGVDGRNRYEDFLKVSFHGASRRAKKTMQLLWMCPGLGSFEDRDLPMECRADRRDHEGLLRAHFSEYHLLFSRGPGFWHIMIFARDSKKKQKKKKKKEDDDGSGSGGDGDVDGDVDRKLREWQLERDLAEAAASEDKEEKEKEEDGAEPSPLR